MARASVPQLESSFRISAARKGVRAAEIRGTDDSSFSRGITQDVPRPGTKLPAEVLVIMAEGFEEMELVIIVDVLRRAEVAVTLAGLSPGAVRGSHDIQVVADCSIDSVVPARFDALVLPGGLPGSTTLRDDPRVLSLIRHFAADGKLVAAICAAPIALEAAGVLEGRTATSFPGHALPSATYVEERVVEDGNVVTSRAAGTAMEFALALVRRLAGADTAETLKARMLVG